MAFQNAWISDRTLCYLASGKPVVLQDTGPSATLPNGLGMFRFRSLEEAALAFETIGADYPKHCRAAREIAEAYFDSRAVLARLLDAALG
jgi:glycosyltransferase involved in cell wall biosynthesis